MYRSMNSFKKDWVKALRSGQYKQGRVHLCRPGEEYDEFCCLGVAFDLLVLAGHACEWKEPVATGRLACNTDTGWRASDRIAAVSPKFLSEWLQSYSMSSASRNETHLIGLNDGGCDFNYIANTIERSK